MNESHQVSKEFAVLIISKNKNLLVVIEACPNHIARATASAQIKQNGKKSESVFVYSYHCHLLDLLHWRNKARGSMGRALPSQRTLGTTPVTIEAVVSCLIPNSQPTS
jgi:hypothetical protein